MNDTHEGGSPWFEPGYEAHDARDGNITDLVTVTGTVDENVTGGVSLLTRYPTRPVTRQTLPARLPFWIPLHR